MLSDITSSNHRPLLRKVEGAFFRSVLAERVQSVLAPPGPESAGRYHRLGQVTLYMSPTIEWATIAVSGYIREDNRPRVVVPLMVSDAYVLDQHNEMRAGDSASIALCQTCPGGLHWRWARSRHHGRIPMLRARRVRMGSSTARA